ncbi:hypothetical protein [Pontibacter sp. G13]|uniref:hypothetical protein n=1 Tax=Pontibacter sp. G13 TaxID=3074898 RepID=UPI002889D692|nr:hypothetical protein [Pontibacter sp. G13]WNJ20276.1 hypothetical protein RJD25_07335 [Pontibacter sp. G13]
MRKIGIIVVFVTALSFFGCEKDTLDSVVGSQASSMSTPIEFSESLKLSHFKNHPEGVLTEVPSDYQLKHPDVVSEGYGEAYLFNLNGKVSEIYATYPSNPLPVSHSLKQEADRQYSEGTTSDGECYVSCNQSGEECYVFSNSYSTIIVHVTCE